MREVGLDIADLLIRHELEIKDFYETFAKIFKNHELFWRGLADDEQGHADLLERLKANPHLCQWLQYEGKL